ncbi:MAG: tetratricopeptide repeat protein [Acidobacteria bacterium]|nr:tetratricopeptide repeat protein [Acidobacteriota bacterium]
MPTKFNFHRTFPTLVIGLIILGISVTAQTKRPTAPQRAPVVNQQQFDQYSTQANQAREAGKLDDAIELYQKAISLKPKWNEGWWYLATLLYEKDQYADAAKAFNNSAALNPKVGAPIVMLGLCEFRIGEYDNALAHLIQGRKIGIGENAELAKVMFFHEAMLLVLKGEFEQAERILNKLSYDNVSHEQIFIAHGLAVLRMPMLPQQIGPTHKDREMIRRAGYANHLIAQLNASDGQAEYEKLAADYAKVPAVQYAYGRYLLYTQRDDEAATQAFQRELENSPKHALARLQIAYIKLKNKEPENGIKLAEEAVQLNPRLLLGHYILGRILLDAGETPRAIEELEISQRMAPDEPKIYFALSRAYTKVGRKAEADRARQTFTRLNAAAEAAAAQGQVKGEAIDESAEKKSPTPKP